MTREREWYRVSDPASLPTPALLFYPERIERNIGAAIACAGDVTRLRPHVKTTKCPAVVAMMLAQGITKFKCATLAEARMLAEAGARDVVLAYPVVGPAVDRCLRMAARYPQTAMHAVVDSQRGVDELDAAATAARIELEVLVDLNVGMNRTGADPSELVALYTRIAESDSLTPIGIHAYDGHIHESDPATRETLTQPIVETIRTLERELARLGNPVRTIIAGGTPTFPCYARIPDFELSPGTCFLHDLGYLERYADLPYEPAALIAGRVISRPGGRRFTIDIGSKAISTDQAGSRGVILNYPDATPISQSEEHWVFEASGGPPDPGEVCYVLPRHICPSVNLHSVALAIGPDGVVADRWPITARGWDDPLAE